jgi:hypothetical protein
MNRVDEVVERRAVRPSRQRVRRWERNWDPSLVARNFDPVEYGFLVWGRIMCTCTRVAIMCPTTSFSPGLDSLSVFLMDLTMTRCVRVRVLALFCEGLIVENCNDCEGAESPPLRDIYWYDLV